MFETTVRHFGKIAQIARYRGLVAALRYDLNCTLSGIPQENKALELLAKISHIYNEAINEHWVIDRRGDPDPNHNTTRHPLDVMYDQAENYNQAATELRAIQKKMESLPGKDLVPPPEHMKPEDYVVDRIGRLEDLRSSVVSQMQPILEDVQMLKTLEHFGIEKYRPIMEELGLVEKSN